MFPFNIFESIRLTFLLNDGGDAKGINDADLQGFDLLLAVETHVSEISLNRGLDAIHAR